MTRRYREWTRVQAAGLRGRCYYCGKLANLRLEPFGNTEACKACWQAVAYGQDEQDIQDPLQCRNPRCRIRFPTTKALVSHVRRRHIDAT